MPGRGIILPKDCPKEIAEILTKHGEEWLARWISAHDEVTVPELWHYTSIDGLIGIAKTGKFWATHSLFLNDRSEIVYADEIIQACHAAICERRASEPCHPHLLKSSGKLNLLAQKFAVYVTCFTEEGDSLTQWRGYGSQGGGYGVAIAPSKEAQVDANATRPILLRRVIYDREEQRQWIETAIDAACAASNEIHKAGLASEIRDYVVGLARQLLIECIWCFKSPAFSPEREWRLGILMVDSNVDSIEFRSSRGVAIPYVPFSLSEIGRRGEFGISVTKIVRGPTVGDPEMASAALSKLGRKYFAGKVEILESALPLRF